MGFIRPSAAPLRNQEESDHSGSLETKCQAGMPKCLVKLRTWALAKTNSAYGQVIACA